MPYDHKTGGGEFCENSIQGFLAYGEIPLMSGRTAEVRDGNELSLALRARLRVRREAAHGPTDLVASDGDVHAGMQSVNFLAQLLRRYGNGIAEGHCPVITLHTVAIEHLLCL